MITEATDLTDDQLAMQDSVRDFVRGEVTPHAADWDREAKVPLDTIRRLGEMGYMGVTVPSEWGGSGADFMSYVLLTEELAYGDAGLCNLVNATNSFANNVLAFGTERQKETFLRPVASGKQIACMLLSEPQAGSDAANLLTRAVRKGDNYMIDGSKCFVTSGRSAKVAIVVAVTEPSAGKRGISAFIVPTDTPGYYVLRAEKKLGHRANDTCQVALEGMVVPAENLLGELGTGLTIALSGLEAKRIVVAAQAIGVAQAAFDAALRYAKDRKAFGKAIIEHQAVAFTLAEMATEIEVARQMCHFAARIKGRGIPCAKEASMVKLYASQMCERVCSAAIKMHGGYGFLNDYPVEKYYRDAMVFQLYDGTNEIQKMLISRELAK
ncbi:MAG: acyl-CoA dehydrogenase family protein [Pseudomonadota bacterium]|nr:acyl-CoA dehydrogenase family protein [Pseudomonadota bacterium]